MIIELRHPDYLKALEEWSKWRSAYNGDSNFINTYLKSFYTKETTDDFNNRKAITYSPNFGKAAIVEIKNSIYQRMISITRDGGDQSYQDCITGLKGGVNLKGSTINHFMGTKVLEELLFLGKSGIMVDMPELSGITLLDNKDKHPYLYHVCAEDIVSWSEQLIDDEIEYTKLLVKSTLISRDEEFGLPQGYEIIYRYFYLTVDGVFIETYNEKNEIINEKRLPLTRLPFICLELSQSLMTGIDRYQIALLNLASQDLLYTLKSNITFYTEQFDARTENVYSKQSEEKTIEVGATGGRRYPRDTDRPGFIHPSSEPLKASMDKQEAMKKDIRQLVQLNVATLESKFASAESKGKDTQTLESGLSYIGLELENAERKIGKLWSEYMNSKPPTIFYPTDYSLKTDSERTGEATDKAELVPVVPSTTFKKEMCKGIADVLLSNKVSKLTLDKIKKEIDVARYITSDPTDIETDVNLGLVTKKTAAEARGYDPNEVEEARKERAVDLRLIQDAQTTGLANPAAKGIPDLSVNAKQDQKQDGGGRPKGK